MGDAAASLKGNFGLVALAICDLRQLGVRRRRPSRNPVRIVFESEFWRRPRGSVKERVCAGLARAGPAADRNETVYGPPNLIGGAPCVALIIGIVPANVVCQSATSAAPEPRRRTCAPHQTSSRDYANPIVSYPVDGKYRHGELQLDRSVASPENRRAPAAAAGSLQWRRCGIKIMAYLTAVVELLTVGRTSRYTHHLDCN